MIGAYRALALVDPGIGYRACGVHHQSIDQLAYVQETTNGMESSGAQYLLDVKTAIINGRLDRYTGHHSVPENIAA